MCKNFLSREFIDPLDIFFCNFMLLLFDKYIVTNCFTSVRTSRYSTHPLARPTRSVINQRENSIFGCFRAIWHVSRNEEKCKRRKNSLIIIEPWSASMCFLISDLCIVVLVKTSILFFAISLFAKHKHWSCQSKYCKEYQLHNFNCSLLNQVEVQDNKRHNSKCTERKYSIYHGYYRNWILKKIRMM